MGVQDNKIAGSEERTLAKISCPVGGEEAEGDKRRALAPVRRLLTASGVRVAPAD